MHSDLIYGIWNFLKNLIFQWNIAKIIAKKIIKKNEDMLLYHDMILPWFCVKSGQLWLMTDGSYVVAQKRAAGLVPNVKNPFAALVKVDIIKLSQKQVKYGPTLAPPYF